MTKDKIDIDDVMNEVYAEFREAFQFLTIEEVNLMNALAKKENQVAGNHRGDHHYKFPWFVLGIMAAKKNPEIRKLISKELAKQAHEEIKDTPFGSKDMEEHKRSSHYWY